MRFELEQLDWTFQPPLSEPAWSSRVPRWYQLDGAAFALTELFSRRARSMDFLILASPMASNLTDWQFAQSGAQHAQKFVHTLPNIRASMALKAANHACDFVCLQKGPLTHEAALIEFQRLAPHKPGLALALLDLLEIDEKPEKRQVYRVTLMSQAPESSWTLQRTKASSQPPKLGPLPRLEPQEKTLHWGDWKWENRL